MKKETEIYLADMPFSSFAMPVYSLSLLKGELNRAGLGSEVIYGNMLFAREIGVGEYIKAFSWVSAPFVFGEAVFARAAHGTADAAERYERLLREDGLLHEGYVKLCLDLFRRIEAASGPYIDRLSDMILAKKPRIVGLSSVFMQNNACLALARQLKKKQPSLITMIGGANSIGVSAWGLVKYNPFIDYAFSGEADAVFADFCARLLREGHPAKEELPYGVLRADMDIDGAAVPIGRTAELDAMAYPDYSDYFASLEKYGLRDKVSPSIISEFSRGCWWNDKKPCTFCGLNNGRQHYRIKSTERVLREIEYFKKSYDCKKLTLADNVFSAVHIKELLPALAAQEDKLLIQCEVKSNLTKEQLLAFRRAGFSLLQPGIESLNDNVLRLMNKGNRAIKQVEFLKNTAELGLQIVWNFLAGFPGETAEDYQELAELVPLITHLRVPLHFSHIFYSRGNEYQLHPEKYGLKLRPARAYDIAYPAEEMRQLAAVYYEPVERDKRRLAMDIGLHSEAHAAVRKEVALWTRDYARGRIDRLTARDRNGVLEVMDMRRAAAGLYHQLTDCGRAVALKAGQVIGRKRLIEELAADFEAADTEAAIEALKAKKLLLEINGELLFLPLFDGRALTRASVEEMTGCFLELPEFPVSIFGTEAGKMPDSGEG